MANPKTPNLGLNKVDRSAPTTTTFNTKPLIDDNADLLDAKFGPSTGHKHTGAAGDAPQIDNTGLANGAATDTVIGNRTVDDTATPNTGPNTLTNILSFIGKMIRQITGKSSWTTAPAINLETVSSYLDQSVKKTSSPTFSGLTVSGGTVKLSGFNGTVETGVFFDGNAGASGAGLQRIYWARVTAADADKLDLMLVDFDGTNYYQTFGVSHQNKTVWLAKASGWKARTSLNVLDDGVNGAASFNNSVSIKNSIIGAGGNGTNFPIFAPPAGWTGFVNKDFSSWLLRANEETGEIVTKQNVLDNGLGNMDIKGSVAATGFVSQPSGTVANSWSHAVQLRYRDAGNIMKGAFVQAGADGRLMYSPTGTEGYAVWNDGVAPVNKALNGYLKFPNGIIIQWGIQQLASGVTITFPTAFPTSCGSVTATPGGGSALASGVSNITGTNFIVQHGNGATATFVQWMAIGW